MVQRTRPVRVAGLHARRSAAHSHSARVALILGDMAWVRVLQVISKVATEMRNATADEYTARAAARMQAEGNRLLQLLDDLDELLSTHQ